VTLTPTLTLNLTHCACSRAANCAVCCADKRHHQPHGSCAVRYASNSAVGRTVGCVVSCTIGSSANAPSLGCAICGADGCILSAPFHYAFHYAAGSPARGVTSSTVCLNHRYRCRHYQHCCQHRRRAGITPAPPLPSPSMSAMPSAPASAAPSVPSLHRQHRRLQFRSLPLRHRQRWQPRHR
jgi:hypothetical protein